MEYEVGKQYEMQVIDIRKDSAGYDYIALHDENEDKEYRVYNILKCQYESLPSTLYVIVKSIDVHGRIRFRQDEERLVKEHYKVGKLYAFRVTEVKQDFRTKAPYYVVEDDFTQHHFYFNGEQKYQVGSDCILEVDGFTEKGFVHLKEVQHITETEIEQPSSENPENSETQVAQAWNNLPVLEGVDECETQELKVSIAFPAGGNGEPNIDKQLYVILKELTAFMNTRGGELYIGIHDKTKKVKGISGDFQYLNDGEDEFAGTYSENIDGYELKIRNTMDKLCPSVANSLTTIEFPSIEGRVYCKITVKPARRPIFLAGTQLYIRQGNRMKLLKGDEITFFVTERMTVSIKDILDTEGAAVPTAAINVDEMVKTMQQLLNQTNTIPEGLPQPKPLDEVDYWLIWYDDATWKRARVQSEEPNVHIQVPVYKSVSDPIVVFCYETGKVNTIKLSDFRKGANLNKLQKNGWSRTGEKPMNIFIVHATDYLVGYSVDHNGTECVKLHAISDYPVKSSAANQGSPFVPDGWQVKVFAVIGAEHKSSVAHLIVTKQKRTVNAGTPLNSASMKGEIEQLGKILPV